MMRVEELTSEPQRRNWAWRRWCARSIDEVFGLLVIYLIIVFVGGLLPEDSGEPANEAALWAELFSTLFFLAFVVFSLPLSFLASSLQYALFRQTLGKRLCGVIVCDADGRRISRLGFLWRDVKALVVGDGLHIHVFALIANLIQYSRLCDGKPARYEADNAFQAQPTREKKWYDGLIVFLAFILLFVQVILTVCIYS